MEHMRTQKMVIGNRTFTFGEHTYVMGILNVTPDSFSDGGNYVNQKDALRQVEKMIKAGVDIVDVGGESTHPGYVQISEAQEIERVCPVIEKIKTEFDIPVSLDTYKARVAQAGVRAGIDMINDIWGLQYDKEMADVVAKSGLPYVLMHNRKEIDATGDFWKHVLESFQDSLLLARNAGIDEGKIILDPGIGFAKTYEQNLLLLNKLRELGELGYPVLLGCSRKSVIGLCLDIPVKERLAGTLATTSLAVMQGCGVVRVHDVKENVETIKMMETVLQTKA